MTPQERFWARVDKTGECWLWTGRVDEKGYGRISVGGRTKRVHRLSYEWAFGPIAPGLEIDHKCRARGCVRPAHLQAVTHALNQQNMSAERKNNTSGVRGVSWHSAKRRWVVQAARQYGGAFRTLEEAELAAIALRNRIMANNLADREAS